MQTGGGIKTKMVEAIAYGTTVILTQSGATGIIKNICGEKLIIIPDNDWTAFSNAIISNADKKPETPEVYYDYLLLGERNKKYESSIT